MTLIIFSHFKHVDLSFCSANSSIKAQQPIVILLWPLIFMGQHTYKSRFLADINVKQMQKEETLYYVPKSLLCLFCTFHFHCKMTISEIFYMGVLSECLLVLSMYIVFCAVGGKMSSADVNLPRWHAWLGQHWPTIDHKFSYFAKRRPTLTLQSLLRVLSSV